MAIHVFRERGEFRGGDRLPGSDTIFLGLIKVGIGDEVPRAVTSLIPKWHMTT